MVTTKATKKNAPCTINVTNPKGRTTSLKTKPVPEGYEAVFTPWDTGIHKVKVEYDSKEIPDSPFSVEVFKVNINAVLVKGLEKRKFVITQEGFVEDSILGNVLF